MQTITENNSNYFGNAQVSNKVSRLPDLHRGSLGHRKLFSLEKSLQKNKKALREKLLEKVLSKTLRDTFLLLVFSNVYSRALLLAKLRRAITEMPSETY